MCQQEDDKYLYLCIARVVQFPRVIGGPRVGGKCGMLPPWIFFPSRSTKSIIHICSTIVLVRDNVLTQDAGE